MYVFPGVNISLSMLKYMLYDAYKGSFLSENSLFLESYK